LPRLPWISLSMLWVTCDHIDKRINFFKDVELND